jgi:hypothetical protein
MPVTSIWLNLSKTRFGVCPLKAKETLLCEAIKDYLKTALGLSQADGQVTPLASLAAAVGGNMESPQSITIRIKKLAMGETTMLSRKWFTATTALFIALLFSTLHSIACYADEGEESIVPDRPDFTDSSVTVGHLHFQVEFGALWEWQRIDGSGLDTVSAPLLLRLGLGDDFELRLESNTLAAMRVSQSAGGSGWTKGFSPVGIGFKYHFKDVGTSPLDPSLGVLVTIGLPSGTGDFHSDSTTFLAKLSAEFDLAPGFGLGTNVGLLNDTNDLGMRYTAALASASFGIDLGGRAGAFFDGYVLSNGAGDEGVVAALDTGFTYLVNPDMQYDIAIGSGVRGEDFPDFYLTSGLSLRF